MEADHKEKVDFLKDQLREIKEQDQILAEIEERLLEMRSIAEYASDSQLSKDERIDLNQKMKELLSEIAMLKGKMQRVVH